MHLTLEHPSIQKCSSLSRVRPFAAPRTVARQDPLSMECPRQDYWSGLPLPSPGDLPSPGIESGSCTSQANFYRFRHHRGDLNVQSKY